MRKVFLAIQPESE